MKPKSRPESKIPTTKTNTNKKRGSEVPDKDKKIEASLFKKNEFALILFGALLLTLIIFFLFFRSSDSETEPVIKIVSGISFADLEKRIEKIEIVLQIQENSDQTAAGKTQKSVSGVDPVRIPATK